MAAGGPAAAFGKAPDGSAAAEMAAAQQGPAAAAAAAAAPGKSAAEAAGASLRKAAAGGAEVPRTWGEANTVFLTHPSAATPLVGIVLVAYSRLCLCLHDVPLGLADATVALVVVVFWLVQEWVVHKWLLHSSWDWAGKAIHIEHHQQPYHHVSLDPLPLVAGVMALAAAVFALLLGGPLSPLSLTATAAYWSAGLVYEYTHFIVHTRWVPPAGWTGAWLRAVRRHHMLHHNRHEDYWLSFTAPAVDALFGTLPPPGSVPLSDMARAAHRSPAAGSAAAAARRAVPDAGPGPAPLIAVASPARRR